MISLFSLRIFRILLYFTDTNYLYYLNLKYIHRHTNLKLLNFPKLVGRMQQHFVDTYYFLKWTYGYYPIKAIKYLVRYLHQNM